MQKPGSRLWNFIEKTAGVVLGIVFKLSGKELSEEMLDSFLQFMKFGIVGVSNTVLSYVLYAVSLLLFRKAGFFVKSDYVIAQLIAFLLSVLWSFYWNNKMVFTLEAGEKRNLWHALLKTYVSYSFTGLFLNSVLLILWVQVFHISEFIAPVINLLVSVPVNFLINKFWAFKV